MKGTAITGTMRRTRRAAITAALLLCLPAAGLVAQHRYNSAPRSSESRAQAPRQQGNREPQSRSQGSNRPEGYGRSAPSYPQYRGQGQAYPGGAAQRPQGYPQYQRSMPQAQPYRSPRTAPQQNTYRPAAPYAGSAPSYARPAQPGSVYQGQGYNRAPEAGSLPRPSYAPSGHLGAWLDEHRNAPPQTQQRMLQSDPSFSRLPQATQQRLVQQLNRVDQMPEAQRERRLARAENLERLSPAERAQVSDSARRWTTLPADRQALMKNAFRDLRSVPLDQRQTVLNSSRYQNVFSPDERGILSNMLRVEPYEAPR